MTAEHIAKGRPSGCYSCPIALALIDMVKPKTSVRVSHLAIGLYRWPDYWEESTPTRAEDFIWKFDQGKDVKPFAFDLDIPAEFLRVKGGDEKTLRNDPIPG